jgi:hypothetical protein
MYNTEAEEAVELFKPSLPVPGSVSVVVVENV